VTSVVLPDTASVEGSDAVEARGIHVTAADEVAVFGLNRQKFTTDAYLALPSDVVGTDYTVMAWGRAPRVARSCRWPPPRTTPWWS
jgi:hypothetical protein